MRLTPRPGVSLDDLVKNLAFARSDASNRVTGATTAHKRLLAYLEWAGQAARLLRYQVSEADLTALVLNRRYEVLLSSFGTMSSTSQRSAAAVSRAVG